MASREDVTVRGTAVDVVSDKERTKELVSPSCTLLHETCVSPSKPTANELADYAEYIGIDIQKDAHMLYLVREGLTAQLPKDWNAYQNDEGDIFYWNRVTGVSSWNHPMDEYYRGLIKDLYGCSSWCCACSVHIWTCCSRGLRWDSVGSMAGGAAAHGGYRVRQYVKAMESTGETVSLVTDAD